MSKAVFMTLISVLIISCGSSQPGALGEQETLAFEMDQVTGIWRDDVGGFIVAVTMVGDEVRAVVAEGDFSRYTKPLAEKQVADPDAIAAAVGALDNWKDPEKSIPEGAKVYVLAGRIVTTEEKSNSAGSWGDGAECTGDPAGGKGHYNIELKKDSEQGQVLYIGIVSMIKEYEAGYGGDAEDFMRTLMLTKRPAKIKPTLLEKMQKTENFCRKPGL